MAKMWDAWFKFYPRDYMEKTRQLSLEQRGAYMDCICMQMMTEAPIPDDYAWLAHQMHVSSRKAKSIVESLIETCKLRRIAEGIVNDRCVFELEAKLNQRRVNTENAANRTRKLIEKPKFENEINDTAEASLTQTSHTRARVDTDTDTEKKKKRAPDGAVRSTTDDASKGTRLAKDWGLPTGWVTWAGAHLELDELKIASEAERFRDYWVGVPGQKGRKTDWEATWRNWLRRNYPDRKAASANSDVRRPTAFWWRQKPEQARNLPADVWRKAITNFANGTWPIETLGPPPGADGCLIPDNLIADMRLTEVYTDKGIKRA